MLRIYAKLDWLAVHGRVIELTLQNFLQLILWTVMDPQRMERKRGFICFKPICPTFGHTKCHPSVLGYKSGDQKPRYSGLIRNEVEFTLRRFRAMDVQCVGGNIFHVSSTKSTTHKFDFEW